MHKSILLTDPISIKVRRQSKK